MKEVFEKIIERLANIGWVFADYYPDGTNISRVSKKSVPCDEVVEIVKQAAAEYNNGWIPCSERLPEEHDSMLARFKVTDKWRDSMFEKTSNEVIVTISDEKGEKVTTHAHTTDGTWKCDILRACPTYRVIAWQPFPDPYQPLSNDSTDAGARYKKSAWRSQIMRDFLKGLS